MTLLNLVTMLFGSAFGLVIFWEVGLLGFGGKGNRMRIFQEYVMSI